MRKISKLEREILKDEIRDFWYWYKLPIIYACFCGVCITIGVIANL